MNLVGKHCSFCNGKIHEFRNSQAHAGEKAAMICPKEVDYEKVALAN